MRRHFDSPVTRLANLGSGDVFVAIDGAIEFSEVAQAVDPESPAG
jgi:hypothetical protein